MGGPASISSGGAIEGQAVVGLEMVDDRNLTVHTYSEAVAERISQNLPRYADLLAHWLTAMQVHIKT